MKLEVASTKVARKNSFNYFLNAIGKQEARDGIKEDIAQLLKTCSADLRKEELAKDLDGFQLLFDRFISEGNEEISWDKILPPPADRIKPYSSLSEPSDVKEMLGKLVVVKLNGGLGTSMGCTGPKSLITVRDDYTFLDMQVQQLENLNDKYECGIPLVLMNSFNAENDTQKVLKKYGNANVPLYSFQQSQHPRIYKESLRTVPKSAENPNEFWYPPGHGDLYQSFYNSGLLQKFIDEGKEYIFVSNIDNLGATVDLSILDYLLSQPEDARCEFLMEVTDKTKSDVKGGTLVEYNGKLRLLEMAQVPRDHIGEFKSISKFKIFNTNNLWVQLPAIKHAVEMKSLHMEIITNHKQLDNGSKIIQLETAIGAAIKSFNHSLGVNVPRDRFLPVKTCSDLLLVQSNLYHVKCGTLAMSPARQFPTPPLVQLGKQFEKVKNFLSRFDGIPDIIDLDHLTVAGDVTFGHSVVLKGTVIIIANHGDRIDIPPGTILENKIVSGNLRIMDH